MTPSFETKPRTCLWRSAEPVDEELLFQLFVEAQQHIEELQLDPAMWRSLVGMQYKGRRQSWAASYPGAVDSILCLQDELGASVPVGRLLVDRRPGCWRIVDVAVLAAYRNIGLGSWAVKSCQQQAHAAGARLELQVRPENPARLLYERLGFKAVSESPLAVEMIWSEARMVQ